MVYGVMTAGNMSAAVTLTMSVVIVCLARIFHDKAGVRHAYLAGIALACAAMAWPYVLALLPVLLFFLIKPQEAFSLRNVAAMMLGILTPGWIYLPYWLYVHLKAMDWMLLAEHYKLVQVSVPLLDYGELTPLQPVVYGLLLLLFLILTVRRSSFRYKGKLFVRSQRAMYVSLVWIMVVLIPLFPSFADYLLPLMAACIGPVAAQAMTGNDR